MVGYSLGGAVAIDLSAKISSKALVLLNPLDSLELMLKDCCVLSGWASGNLYSADHFNAAASLSSFRGCLLHFASEEDVIIPFDRQQKVFYEDAANKLENCSIFVAAKCADHNADEWEQKFFVQSANEFFQSIH